MVMIITILTMFCCLATAGGLSLPRQAELDAAVFSSEMMMIIIILIMKMMMMTMIIIIALKGAVRDCLQSPHCTANCFQHVRSSGPSAITCSTQSAYHVQHVVCHVVRRDSSAITFDRVEIAFI